MKKKVSLKDIAQKVGVSTALVSYVLNNKNIGRIGKEVTEKIKDAAKELNYRTNQIARSLKTNRTFIIGLIVADISNTFWSSLARIIEDEAEKYNYTVIFGSSDENAEKSLKLTNILLNHQVDGFILAPAEDSLSQLIFLQENEIPFVLIDRYFPEIKANYVAIDNYKAAYTLVKHVIDKGYKRIGLITFKSSLFHFQERKRGYAAAIEENNVTVMQTWIKEVGINSSKEAVEKAIDELTGLQEPVEVILFASNYLSIYGLKYIVNLPLKVPDDLALISFDESDAADLFYSPVTHIKQPLEQMGQLATKILLEHIEKRLPISEVNLEPEFIIRKSTSANKN
ncbi:LacI family DNA-binding transcriptional regulator [Segetibacter koreensis]|uniref:LacI family DNA-binding transcriptional regulator n=1 Tax=Segetibacter koreensis TaxID=398037 RepID=UPI00036A3691|nr:substrate-binding domain-containing protein [Segetibacter koreensis]